MKCISCGHEIINPRMNCPNCGYRFTADEDYYCPNSHFGKCTFTDTLCNRGIDFITCYIKTKADSEAPF